MNLSGFLSLIENVPSYRELIQDLKVANGERRVVITGTAKPCLIAGLYHHLGLPVLVITARTENARQIYEEIPHWLGSDASIKYFPEPDALPYERLSSDTFTVQQRLRVLSDLIDCREAPVVIASAYAVARKTVPAARFASSCHRLSKGSKIDLERMLAGWVELGYVVESTVDMPGTVSRRGGIVDIFPPNSELPARIELFGNEVDSIRFFDPVTQRSLKPVNGIVIFPAREMVASYAELNGAMQQLDVSTLSAGAKNRINDAKAQFASGKWFDGLDFYTSLVNDGALIDYLPDNTLIIVDEPGLVESAVTELDAQATEIYQVQSLQGELPLHLPVPYFNWPELVSRFNRFEQRIGLEEWDGASRAYVIGFSPAPGYSGYVPDFLKDIMEMRNDGCRITIISQQSGRLSELLAEHDILVSPVTDVAGLPPPRAITLVQGSLSGGWKLEHEGVDIVFSDAEIFGFVKKRRMVSRHPIPRDAFLSELSNGDYVVHVDHGIARFTGLTKVALDNSEREYLVLEYAAADKLYVPTEQADRVSRYIGPGGYTPSLSRLGTREWNRAKQRVKEAAENLARELLSLYSAREVVSGFNFSQDTLWQQEVEASFPYIETQDQLKAVQEVKLDMESARPMDRLVCGDVGYGKTEVAIRAAFKAVMDGMQVAVLVPTTVLAQQHFTTFCERLGAFPVKIELLSRFRSSEEQQEVLEGLLDGSVDICIGTHRLVQKDVVFKNIGLVIIDEEQRFGVSHKERLKQLRKEVDVLTLSATPIPRTLHMSLVGVRDMSTMETPPQERYPIKSYVAPYNELVVREAVLRELERRGQVFYVHNRVQRIGWVARRLEALVPEAGIGVAHGQMPEDVLESVMLDFTEGRIDILVCTTIIESGLDLPNVNTLIVDDADKMGLTQLYQLRGRVGRGANRAYAYFFYDKGKQLTDTAQKRLRTILEASELGAGFRIAMKDLEIRGAGNLLGPEQSGHMGAVGFELYNRLLTEAVSELKMEGGRKPLPDFAATTVDLPLTAHIPEEYVSDISTRLALYMKLAGISSLVELDELGTEMEDRFGALPKEVVSLIYMVRLKLLGSVSGIQEISAEKEQVVIRLSPGVRVDRLSMQESFGQALKVGTNQMRLDIKRAGKGWQGVLEDIIAKVAYPEENSPGYSSTKIEGCH